MGRGGGAHLFSVPVLIVEVRAEGGDVSTVTPNRPPLPLPLVLVVQGSDFRLHLATMVHIDADPDNLGGSICLCPGVAVLPVPLQPYHEATDDGQAGVPTHVLGASHGIWLCLWSWLLMRKLQGLVDVRVLLLLMRMLRGLLVVRVPLGAPRWT